MIPNIHSHINLLSNTKLKEPIGDDGHDIPDISDIKMLANDISPWIDRIVKSAAQLKKLNFMVCGRVGKDAFVEALKRACGKSGNRKIVISEVDAAELMVGPDLWDAQMVAGMVRKSVLLRVREVKDVYEGELVRMSADFCGEGSSANNNLSGGCNVPGGSVTMELRATKDSEVVRLDSKFVPLIRAEGIEVGDIVYLENSLIRRLGRSESYAHCDLECDTFIPVPKGRVRRAREVIQDMSVYDLDLGYMSTEENFSADPVNMPLIQNKVDLLVQKYLDSGFAEVIPSILIVKNVARLTYSPAFEMDLKPTVVFTSCDGEVSDKMAVRLFKVRLGNPDCENVLMRRIDHVGLKCSDDVVQFLSVFEVKFAIRIVDILRSIGNDVDVERVKEIVSMFS
ncbi:RuvB-like helicase 1 [Dictyocoela roeselum]|nr:RuvB-like helicase 1 [Dictyocoela roeselum]